MINTYKDVFLSAPESVVLQALTRPKETAQYCVKEHAKDIVTTDFLKTVAAPKCFKLFGHNISKLLALALLFGVREPTARVPDVVKTRIQAALNNVGQDKEINPIEHVPIIVFDNHGHMSLEELNKMQVEINIYATHGAKEGMSNEIIAMRLAMQQQQEDNH